jgi:hypothetical protein
MSRWIYLGLLLPVLAIGQTVPEPLGIWSYSLGVQRYTEPSMQLLGPEVGLH